MKTTTSLALATVSLATFGLAPASFAQLLFSDNFDSGQSGGNWVPLLSHGDASVDFAFDYGSLGIPAAPNSSGTTTGMRFLVNQGTNPDNPTAGTFQGISASPLDQHFTGDFVLRFDAWMNFVGPFPGGGNGSTQMITFGWGTAGNTVQWAAANSSILFAASGDGGTSQDYRVYRAAGGAPLSPAANPGVYAAGNLTGSTAAPADSRNNTDPYYASLGGEVAPAGQTAEYPQQTGTTAVGTFGMAWRDVIIEKSGETVTWTVDGLRIATVSTTGAALSGDNITFGMFDINANASSELNDFLNAAIFDNIRVTQVPEPSAAALLALGSALLLRRRARCSVTPGRH